LFIVSLIIGGIFNYLLAQLVDRTGLSGTDRMLGMIFGVGRGVLLVGVLVLLGNFSPFAQDTWWQSSKLIPHFQGLALWLQNFLPVQFNQLAQYMPGQL
jgi:membrane protein required for colicin V production